MPDEQKDATSPSHRAFVGKIPVSVTQNALQKYFTQYGTVTDIFLPASNQGKPSLIAFVTFEDEKGLSQALNADHTLQGSRIRVTRAAPKGQSVRVRTARNARLFVGNLDPAATEEELTKHFSQFGEVLSAILHPGKNGKGYAFVSLSTPQQMFSALAATPPKFHGSEAKVVEAQPKPSIRPAYASYGSYGGPPYQQGYGYPPPQPYPPRRSPVRSRDHKERPRIFITLPPDTTDIELKEYFQQYGTVTDVFIPRGRKSIAFVSMSSPTQMYAALAAGPLVLKGVDMRAVEAQPKGASTADPGRKIPRIFIGRIPQTVEDAHLRCHFEQYGIVKDLYRPKSNRLPNSQIAFCVFQDNAALYKCLGAGSTQTVNGAELTISKAEPRPSGPPAYVAPAHAAPAHVAPAHVAPAQASSGYPQSYQYAPSMSQAGYGYSPYPQQQGYAAQYGARSRQQRYSPY